MTPLQPKEQAVLAGLLSIFVIGSALLAWQKKSLDRELSGLSAVASGAASSVGRQQLQPGQSLSPRLETVSISRAGAVELETLPGIGPKLAEEIVRYRQKNPFRSVDELLKVPGIGPKKLEKMRNRVKVD